MSATEMTLCVLCFQPVLECSACEYCDANCYCPGQYVLRARQQGILHLEGGLDGALSDSEFVPADKQGRHKRARITCNARSAVKVR
jgi:hypothetical protein